MIHQDNKKHISEAAATHLEAYLFYHKISKTEKKGNFDEFFAKLNQLDEDLADSIIFLEPDSAWQYSRFIDTSHAILKILLPQTAIEGRSHGLTLKKGFLTKAHVHGCFPGWAKGLLYIKNPYFNEHLFQKQHCLSTPDIFAEELIN